MGLIDTTKRLTASRFACCGMAAKCHLQGTKEGTKDKVSPMG